MNLLEAVRVIEGDIKSTKQRRIHAWQWMIDEGHAWKLQGWYGRQATDLIEEGICDAPAAVSAVAGAAAAAAAATTAAATTSADGNWPSPAAATGV